ncbi:DUF760 domain-containing protein [Nostoc sp. FACHB-152]|uniref:DUF760 domain-containing protein n=1 Tax=unclassified Nostoc TaxID=2593658 RepID=UPI0016867667|nr:MULTISPECIES: DUF760 domain-containing protein [unclassified Nostoc]MBD2446356.1 DUF760 domain-containing protein [Nostoc sp. FACHB-152]MBD2471815.1 DUF760 domain-containing protein [Nostoc sp. FACHB-145]
MSNLSPRQPENITPEEVSKNQFWEYVQSLNRETVVQLSKPDSPEVLQLINQAIVAMLGNLPNDRFNTLITTSREELGRLLGSAMVDGYFLRNAEQRFQIEKALRLTDDQAKNIQQF